MNTRTRQLRRLRYLRILKGLISPAFTAISLGFAFLTPLWPLSAIFMGFSSLLLIMRPQYSLGVLGGQDSHHKRQTIRLLGWVECMLMVALILL